MVELLVNIQVKKLRYIFLTLSFLILTAFWLMRPWTDVILDMNAAYRGSKPALRVNNNCVAIESDGRFNWAKIRTDIALKDCLMVVARNLETPALMAEWLTTQGFNVTPPYNTVPEGSEMLGARWPMNGNPAIHPYGGGLIRMKDRLSRALGKLSVIPFIIPAKEYLIVITYSGEGTILVDANTLYL